MARIGAITDDFRRVLEPIIDDGEEAVQDTVQRGKDVVTGGTATAVEQILRSSEFAVVLDKVEEKARLGVAKEAGRNALALGGVAVAAAAIGGKVLKGDKGFLLALAIGAWGFATLVSTQQSTKGK